MRDNGRQHPFRELRGREHITFQLDHAADAAGGAIYARRGDQAIILISPELDQVARSCALAHELVHDELGIVSPPAPDLVMERVEDMVDRRTADWLVPIDELAPWVEARVQVEPVTARLVAQEFGVTEEVATRALLELARTIEPPPPPMSKCGGAYLTSSAPPTGRRVLRPSGPDQSHENWGA